MHHVCKASLGAEKQRSVATVVDDDVGVGDGQHVCLHNHCDLSTPSFAVRRFGKMNLDQNKRKVRFFTATTSAILHFPHISKVFLPCRSFWKEKTVYVKLKLTTDCFIFSFSAGNRTDSCASDGSAIQTAGEA